MGIKKKTLEYTTRFGLGLASYTYILANVVRGDDCSVSACSVLGRGMGRRRQI